MVLAPVKQSISSSLRSRLGAHFKGIQGERSAGREGLVHFEASIERPESDLQALARELQGSGLAGRVDLRKAEGGKRLQITATRKGIAFSWVDSAVAKGRRR